MNKHKDILINGEAFSWSLLNVLIGDSLFYGITSISIAENQNIAPIYNGNPFLIGYGKGKVSIDISMTIELAEYRILCLAANERNVYNLQPFPITLQFMDEGESLNTIPFTYIFEKCMITNVSQSFTQNSPNSYVTLTIKASSVLRVLTRDFILKYKSSYSNLVDIYSKKLTK